MENEQEIKFYSVAEVSKMIEQKLLISLIEILPRLEYYQTGG